MTRLTDDGTVEFRFFRPDVQSVSISGDFGVAAAGMDLQCLDMQRQGDGWWTLEAKLPAGEYRFRYLADGRWFADYASHGVEQHKQGWLSVLVVPKGVASQHIRARMVA